MKSYLRTNHPINKMDGRKIDSNILYWLTKWSLEHCQYVYIAVDKGMVVGFFRFDLCGKELNAAGTWVSRRYRGKGIAKTLWMKALKKIKPKTIQVVTTSKGGYNLVRSVSESIPNHFHWEKWDKYC
jgi:GNAT superfamily N-acetyltransferase